MLRCRSTNRKSIWCYESDAHPNGRKLIDSCWIGAEEALRKNVREKFPDRDEEMITDLFHAELEQEFAKVSRSGAVARAFLDDLESAFPRIAVDDLHLKIARRLIATVSFHPPKVEEKTGGDLGVVLVRPNIRERSPRREILSRETKTQTSTLLLIRRRLLPRPWARSIQGANLTAFIDSLTCRLDPP